MDNTVRENKNQIVLSYLSLLCARHQMDMVALLSARVGHTHNRLDGVYGLLAHAFRYVSELLDLAHVKENLGKQLEKKPNPKNPKRTLNPKNT